MIDTKEKLAAVLEVEKDLYCKGKWIWGGYPFLITESQILYRHAVLLRKAEYYTNAKKRMHSVFFRVRLFRLQNKYSLHIPINCFGKGLSIAHVGPIVINDKCRIGENCRIHVGVNIGADAVGAPEIGANVYIGPGAKIFGKIRIADNCRIGANAVVNKSCAVEGTTLVGVPARQIGVG